MRLIVCVPTYGRPALVRQTVQRLERQTRKPDAVWVSAPDESHVEPIVSAAFPVKMAFGARGSSRQRNRALSEFLPECDVVVFFDDDFLPADDYLENVEAAFERNSDWVVLTGDVLIDGINGRGLSYDEAVKVLDGAETVPLDRGRAQDWRFGYGCNMALRAASIGNLRFDERLVLYGWLEDVDFTRRVGASGRIVHHSALRGVHMGNKSGRMNGMPLGYSQIVNPLYLMRKGSMTPRMAAIIMSRNVLANTARLVWPEPWIDRKGRLLGNLIAAGHVLRGRLEPERAEELLT